MRHKYIPVNKPIKIALLIITLIGFFQIDAAAQLVNSRSSKKELLKEIERLNKVIDSMKISDFADIPIADTITVNDTINPGNPLWSSEEQLKYNPESTDSLLNIWYLQKQIGIAPVSNEDIDEVHYQSNIPDSIYIQRLKEMNSFIPLPYNDVIRNHIIYYTDKIPNKTGMILGLAGYYMPIFEEIFDQYELPKELKVMAIIESALNPKAVSRVKAKGMWQFMYRTALQYDLEINSYIDERLDPIASTHAAAQYLKDSYTIFGDWSLAIASYNCGAGNVNKAIKRAGGSRDFWSIYPYLPKETRGYVPAFVAALYTVNYYNKHNIVPVKTYMPVHIDTFLVSKPLHFEQISQMVGIPKQELEDLNPQYFNDIIPGNESKQYILKLPLQYTNKFLEYEDSVYTYKDSLYFNPLLVKDKSTNLANSYYEETEGKFSTYKVRSGDTFAKIAKKYGVTIANLKRWNNLKNRLIAGKKLKIYTVGNIPDNLSTTSSSSQKRQKSEPSKTSSKYITYTVKKGDSLWDIAKKFDGVSLQDLLNINGFTRNSKITPGTKIKIKPV